MIIIIITKIIILIIMMMMITDIFFLPRSEYASRVSNSLKKKNKRVMT